MKKVLIIGANGMAGHVISEFLREDSVHFDVYTLARKVQQIHIDYELDLFKFENLAEIITREDFDFIINCAGVLNKFAEENPVQAKYINSELPHLISNLVFNKKTKVIHLSTDCVFSGKKGNYVETDVKNGLGNYAKSKSYGELINDKDLTIRTSIIGPDLTLNGIGLFNWVMMQSGEINGYKEAFWSGITTVELARIIRKIILKKPFLSNVIHITNNDKLSKFDLLSLIKNEFKLNDLTINETRDYKVDKSLKSTRKDIEDIFIKSYFEMILEMHSWILNHKQFYPHYNIKIV